MITKKIENLLQKQLDRGIYIYNDFGIIQKHSEQFSVEELDVTNELLIEILHSNGYITPDKRDFIEKIKLLFDIEYSSNNNFYSYPISELKSKELIFFNKEEDFYISKYGFISGFYFIPELIDYKKIFPIVEIKILMLQKKYFCGVTY